MKITKPDSDSLECGRCGYDLHGLPETYVCPECALPYDAHSVYFPLQGESPWFTLVVGALFTIFGATGLSETGLILGPVFLIVAIWIISVQLGPGSYFLISRAGVTKWDTRRGPLTIPWSRVHRARRHFWTGRIIVEDATGRTLLFVRLRDTGKIAAKLFVQLINHRAGIYRKEAETGGIRVANSIPTDSTRQRG